MVSLFLSLVIHICLFFINLIWEFHFPVGILIINCSINMVRNRKSSDAQNSNLTEDTNGEKGEEKNKSRVNLRDINDCYVYKITEGSFHVKKVSSSSCFSESLRVWN